MSETRGNKGRIIRPLTPEIIADGLQRFFGFCRFEPETGCVIWTGGTSYGRGHHDPYPKFWFNGTAWFGHRWSAKFIKGQEIEGRQTDHCCPNIPIPNTLCVDHVQSLTPKENRDLQTERRKHFVHLQVGLRDYFEVYGHAPGVPEVPDDYVPYYDPPAWFAALQGKTDGDCPF